MSESRSYESKSFHELLLAIIEFTSSSTWKVSFLNSSRRNLDSRNHAIKFLESDFQVPTIVEPSFTKSLLGAIFSMCVNDLMLFCFVLFLFCLLLLLLLRNLLIFLSLYQDLLITHSYGSYKKYIHYNTQIYSWYKEI